MSLGRQAVRGAAWTVATGVGARAFGLVGTLLLVRWVDPDDYGVVSAASVLALTANQLSTLGLGNYLIAHPWVGRVHAFHATVIHLVLGAAALGGAAALAGPLGPWFEAPTLHRYVPGLALALMLDRASYVPERLLVRDLKFGTVSVARTVGEVAYTGVSIATAIWGWGGYAVVAGNLARSLLRSAILIAATERRAWLLTAPIRGATLREIAGYGLIIWAGALAGLASRRWDNLLVSRYYGPAVMGAYNLAYNLADVPAVQVGEQITDVLFASLSKMERARRLATLVRSVGLLALVMFPLAVGLGTIAPTVGEVFFNRRWAAVAPMLTVLSALSVARPIGMALTSYMLAERQARMATLLESLQLAVLMGAIATVGRIGPLWTCGAVGMVFALRTLSSMVWLRVREGLPIGRLLKPLGPPLAACAPMVAAMLLARAALHRAGIAPGAALVVELVVGAAGYAAAALVVARAGARELLRLLRRSREPAVAAVTPS